MNTVVTSRQALLAASRTVARRQGLGGLSIRAVAAEARVSVGSVYNYFSGKTELLAATVEEIDLPWEYTDMVEKLKSYL